MSGLWSDLTEESRRSMDLTARALFSWALADQAAGLVLYRLFDGDAPVRDPRGGWGFIPKAELDRLSFGGESEPAPSASPSGDVVADVRLLSALIDYSYPGETLSLAGGELAARRRVDKLVEEVGEVVEALGGWSAENPRKGQTHSLDDVRRELLQVAVCALAAFEHFAGFDGSSLAAMGVVAREDRERLQAAVPPDVIERALAVLGAADQRATARATEDWLAGEMRSADA